eukprot:RCo006830
MKPSHSLLNLVLQDWQPIAVPLLLHIHLFVHVPIYPSLLPYPQSSGLFFFPVCAVHLPCPAVTLMHRCPSLPQDFQQSSCSLSHLFPFLASFSAPNCSFPQITEP